MKKISIIIPVYNSEKYLRKCLESVRGQTFSNIEIICVDDGSTDKSKQIIDEFAQVDNRFVVIHQSNKGESNARNVGLKTATGDYIGFLDCDDWIEPDMYEMLLEALEKNQVDIAAAGWVKEYDDKSIVMENKLALKSNVLNQKELMTCVYRRDDYQGFAYMWNKLYKRALLYDKTGEMILFDEKLKLGGDVLFLAQMLMQAQSAVFIDKAVYHYYQRGDSGCHTKEIERLMDWLKAYEYVIELFQREKIEEDVLIWVKRFLAYHSSNVAEAAYKQKKIDKLRICQEIMRNYETEYLKTNSQYQDRIERYKDILNM